MTSFPENLNGRDSERHNDAFLQEYLDTCNGIHLEMRQNGTWLWPEDLLDPENS